MSTPIITLTDSPNALTGSDPLSQSDKGQALMLRLDVNEELDSSTLILQGSSSEQTLVSLNSTDQGPVSNNNWPTKKVNWVIADWGEERSLVSVQVNAAAGKIRLKVFINGGWAPLYPGDIISTASEQRFPAVVTSKLMLEPVDGGNEYGLFSPKPTKITGLIVKCTRQPVNVSVCIDDQPPFFQHAGALPMGQGVPVDDLSAAVNSYLADAQNSKAIPLTVHADTAGEFYIKSFNARAVAVATTLQGTKDGLISIPWGGEASASVLVGAKKEIREVRFKQRTELADERLYWPVPAPTSRQALLCDQQHSVAQAYTVLPQGLVLQGIDLYLRPVKTLVAGAQADIRGKLALHPDNKGEPAENPFAGAELEFELAVNQAGLMVADWQSFDVTSAELSNGSWWAVFTVEDDGELYWYTDVSTSMSAYVNNVLYHVAGGGWLSASQANSPAIWALSRLRLSDRESKTTQLSLRRGKVQLPVFADKDGRVDVTDPVVLSVLNKGAALNRKDLEIVVSAVAPAQVSGQVKMSDLRIVSALST